MNAEEHSQSSISTDDPEKKTTIALADTNGIANSETPAKIEDIIEIDPECYELDLNHGRIGKIEKLDELVNIERLYLRWNFIKKIENLSALKTLQEIEFYDNQITEIENLDELVNLE